MLLSLPLPARVVHAAALVLAFAWGAPAVQAQDDGPSRAGISLPEDRDLENQLHDARRLMEEERWAEAVDLLLTVESANQGALVDVGEGLFRGAAEMATELLHGLPAEAQSLRLQRQEERLNQELEQELSPPNPLALERIVQLGAGLPVGMRARRLLQDLWMDRGYPERAAFYGAALDDSLLALMPADDHDDAFGPAVVHDFHDPALARIDANDFQPLWSFRFEDVSPLRSWGHRLALGNGLVYSTNGHEVVALELDSGKPRWRFDGPPGWESIGVQERDDISAGASPYTLLAPVLADGVLLVVVQEPWSIGRSDRYSRINIRRKLPARRLYAFDALNGSILWKQEVPWENPEARTPVELAAGPPTVVAGRVYLPVYTASGTVDLSLQARDLHSGALLWQRFLISGHLETNLFGNVLSELAVPPPTADLDRVFVCTHLGAVSALDAATGRILWSRLYERTPVRPRQNGQVSSRSQWFHNGAMAYDGKRLVTTPIDCFESMTYQASDGRVLERWPARNDRTYGSLSNLVGLSPQGALFTGLAAVRLPIDQGMPKPIVGPMVYEYATTNQFNLQPGLLIADGLLATGSQRILLLDPETLRERSVLLSWEGDTGARIGPIAATHGWLFVMTRIGIEAFSSPSALVNHLTDPALDLANLDQLLPLLDAFDFRRRPGLGRRVTTAVTELAKQEPFQRRGESLALVSGRIWLLLDEASRAAKALAPLLASEERQLRLDAAGLLLDAPPMDRRGETSREQARQILLQEQPALVRTTDQSYEPLSAVLARAAWHAAMAKEDREAERTALVQILLLHDTGRLLESALPLHQAASIALEQLLAKEDRLRERHESEAQLWLETHRANPAFLRAYGRTTATQTWLNQALQQQELPRDDWIKLLAWVYSYGDPQREWPQVQELFRPYFREEVLPRKLEAKVEIRLDGMTPLQVVPRGEEAFLFLQDGADIQILRMYRDQAKLTATVALQENRMGLPTLQKFTFAVEDGIVVLFGDRWMHIDVEGNLRLQSLPGVLSRVSPLTRIGSQAAFLVHGNNDRLRLIVLDLASGTPFLDREIDSSAENVLQIVANERWLFLLQDLSPRVQRFDLHHWSPAESFTLPVAPRSSEVLAARPFGDGLAIPSWRGSHNSALHILEPGLPTRTLPLDGLDFDTYPVPTGFGWWTRPIGRLGEEPQERTLHYLTTFSPRPWQLPMLHPAARLLPFQGRSSWRQSIPSTEVVIAEPGLDGGTRLRGLQLGGAPELWRLELPELSFDLLEEPQPFPVRGKDGWVVLLRESGMRHSGPLLHVLLVNDQGQLLDRYDSPSQSSSRAFQELYAVPGAVLLRHGSSVTLLRD